MHLLLLEPLARCLERLVQDQPHDREVNQVCVDGDKVHDRDGSDVLVLVDVLVVAEELQPDAEGPSRPAENAQNLDEDEAAVQVRLEGHS